MNINIISTLRLLLLVIIIFGVTIFPGGHSNTNVNNNLNKDFSQIGNDNDDDEESSSSSKAVTIYPGDLLLGGLFPIHYKTADGYCSDEINVDGVVALEAFLHALDLVNPSLQKETGLTLGAVALDTCSSGRVALFNALKFVIKDYLKRKHGPGGGGAAEDPAEPAAVAAAAGASLDAAAHANVSAAFGYSNVVGVVGPMCSSVTVQVANLLSLFRMPQISYAATSPVLSDRRAYPYFLRTVPSDKHQARVMVELLKTRNWTYIGGAFEDNAFGAPAFHEFEKAIDHTDICLAYRWKITADQLNGDTMREWLRRIATDSPRARAVVLFVRPRIFEQIMNAAVSTGLENWFVWLGTDGWGNRLVPPALRMAVEGAIVSVPAQKRFSGFSSYFYSLTPSTNERNVWFKEFWRTVFKCESAEEDALCWKKGQLRHKKGHTGAAGSGGWRFGHLHFIRDAVFAFAGALRKMHQVGCHGGRRGLCYRMRTWIEDPDRTVLMEYLQNASFTGVDGSEMLFLDGHDGIPRYTLMNYQRIFSKRSNASEFSWITVGSAEVDFAPGGHHGHSGSGGGVSSALSTTGGEIRYNKLRFKENGSYSYPESVCSLPCPPGHIRRYPITTTANGGKKAGGGCCWLCEPCPFPTVPVNESHCDTCPILNPDGPAPKFFRPSAGLDHCESTRPDFVHFFNNAVVGVVAVACAFGLLLTTITFLLFLCYLSTPIIKASGRELSIVLLFGIAVCYCTVFIIASPPSLFTCAVVKFLYSVGYTLCYGSIFIKTNRLARIFRPSLPSLNLNLNLPPFGGGITSRRPSSFPADIQQSSSSTKRRPSYQNSSSVNTTNTTSNILVRTKYISPLAQVLFVTGLVIFQSLINVIWFILRPPSAMYKIYFDYHGHRVNVHRVCRGFLNEDMLIGLLFPVTLLIFASFYAFKTRNCPGKFNEMKYIMITTYTACIVWLAFIPVFFATEQLHLRIYAMCASLCINATVALFCMFAPKLFLVLCRPEKNTRASVMGIHKKGRTVSSTPSSPYANDENSSTSGGGGNGAVAVPAYPRRFTGSETTIVITTPTSAEIKEEQEQEDEEGESEEMSKFSPLDPLLPVPMTPDRRPTFSVGNNTGACYNNGVTNKVPDNNNETCCRCRKRRRRSF